MNTYCLHQGSASYSHHIPVMPSVTFRSNRDSSIASVRVLMTCLSLKTPLWIITSLLGVALSNHDDKNVSPSPSHP